MCESAILHALHASCLQAFSQGKLSNACPANVVAAPLCVFHTVKFRISSLSKALDMYGDSVGFRAEQIARLAVQLGEH